MQSVLDSILYYLTNNFVLVNHPAVPLIRKCHVTFDDTITAWSDIGGSRLHPPPPLSKLKK